MDAEHIRSPACGALAELVEKLIKLRRERNEAVFVLVLRSIGDDLEQRIIYFATARFGTGDDDWRRCVASKLQFLDACYESVPRDGTRGFDEREAARIIKVDDALAKYTTDRHVDANRAAARALLEGSVSDTLRTFVGRAELSRNDLEVYLRQMRDTGNSYAHQVVCTWGALGDDMLTRRLQVLWRYSPKAMSAVRFEHILGAFVAALRQVPCSAFVPRSALSKGVRFPQDFRRVTAADAEADLHQLYL